MERFEGLLPFAACSAEEVHLQAVASKIAATICLLTTLLRQSLAENMGYLQGRHCRILVESSLGNKTGSAGWHAGKVKAC